MTQIRTYNYGDTLTQAKTKTQAASFLSAGVYSGLEPTVTGPSTFRLSAGSFVLPSGVSVTETNGTPDLALPSTAVPSGYVDYSVVADHSDIQARGGSVVTYSVVEGRLDPVGDPTATSVVVLWIRLEVGFPLTDKSFYRPAVLKADAIISRLEDLWIDNLGSEAFDVTNGSNVTAVRSSHRTGPHYQGLLLVNSSPTSNQTHCFTVPLPRNLKVRQVEVYADLPSGASISVVPTSTTLTSPATAGTTVTINVGSTAFFLRNEKLLLEGGGNREVITVSNVTGATQFTTSTLLSSFPSGSTVRTLSQFWDEDGDVVGCSPTSVSGPVTGLSTPAVVIAPNTSDKQLVTLGLRVLVPAGGAANAVFIRGLRLVP